MNLIHRKGTYDEKIVSRVYQGNSYGFPMDMRSLTVVDIGGHIGSVAVLCAERGARVISFEPEPSNYEFLKANTVGFVEVSIENCAVGKDGEFPLFRNPNNTGGHSLLPDYEEFGQDLNDSVVVKSKSLKTILKDYFLDKIDYLKLDCEGSEIYIIDDIVLNHEKICHIMLELHHRNANDMLLHILEPFYTRELISDQEYRLTHR